MEVSVDAHERTGVEPPQVELVDVKLMVRFGACGEQHLETTVEEEAIDGLGRTRPPITSEASRTSTSSPPVTGTAPREPGKPAER